MSQKKSSRILDLPMPPRGTLLRKKNMNALDLCRSLLINMAERTLGEPDAAKLSANIAQKLSELTGDSLAFYSRVSNFMLFFSQYHALCEAHKLRISEFCGRWSAILRAQTAKEELLADLPADTAARLYADKPGYMGKGFESLLSCLSRDAEAERELLSEDLANVRESMIFINGFNTCIELVAEEMKVEQLLPLCLEACGPAVTEYNTAGVALRDELNKSTLPCREEKIEALSLFDEIKLPEISPAAVERARGLIRQDMALFADRSFPAVRLLMVEE